MNKKIIIMLLTLMLLTSAAHAVVDESNPATVTVNYVLSLDTSYSVTGTIMSFSARANGTTQTVEPDGQDKSVPRPWSSITNTGEIPQSFSLYMYQDNPAYIKLNVSNSPTMTPNITLSLTGQQLGSELASGGVMPVYAEATFTTPDRSNIGTQSRSLIVTSGAPAYLANVTVAATRVEFDLYTRTIDGSFTASPKDQYGKPIWASVDGWNELDSIGSFVLNANGDVATFTADTVGTVSLSVYATRGGTVIDSIPITITVKDTTPIL